MTMTTTTTPTPTTPLSSRTAKRTMPRPTTRSGRDDLKAAPTVLRSDWIKLSTVRSNKAILGFTAAVGAFGWAVATFVTDEVLTVADVYVYSTLLTAVFAAVAGVLLFSSEAQHGTLAASLTAQPARWVIAVSKTIMASAFGLVLGAAGMAAGFLGALLAGIDMGDTSTMVATTLWTLLFASLSAVLGLGVGMIVRHSAGAISGLLVWWLVVETLLWIFLPAKAGRFLPFVAGGALLDVKADTATPESLAVALTRPQDALVFAGYAVAALVLGTVLLYRRDSN